jgi:tRNA G37 N-methylase TrmD
MCMGKYGLHDRNDKIISISEFYEISLGIYIVSGGEITQLPTLVKMRLKECSKLECD